MPQIQFYALAEDSLAIAQSVEEVAALQYVVLDTLETSQFPRFRGAATVPGWGTADQSTGSMCKAYMAMPDGASIVPQSIACHDGVERFYIDQILNPASVIMRPAGRWDGRTVLSGQVGTCAESREGQLLFKRFAGAIRKRFTRVKAYWVGPAAYAMLQQGARLTISTGSPPEFDLTMDA